MNRFHFDIDKFADSFDDELEELDIELQDSDLEFDDEEELNLTNGDNMETVQTNEVIASEAPKRRGRKPGSGAPKAPVDPNAPKRPRGRPLVLKTKLKRFLQKPSSSYVTSL